MTDVTVPALALALIAVVPMVRVVAGPTVFDRLAGLGVISSKVLVLICLLGIVWGSFDALLDIAVGYALLNFIGTLAASRFLEARGASS